MTVISAKGLVKEYSGVRALDDVSFEVTQGSLFALVGPNGAGKTTLMRMLVDILRPDSGSLQLFGSNNLSAALPHIGYMPEERGLYKSLSAVEIVAYFAQLKGVSRRESLRLAAEAIAQVGMAEHAKRKVEELSKGMAQRIQFAATIVHHPKLLILDEPFSGLDPVSSRFLQDVILDYHAAGNTILLSTHNMAHAEKLCTGLLMLHRGRVQLFGSIDQIKQQFTTQAVEVRYQGELPLLDGVGIEKLSTGCAILTPSGELTRNRLLHILLEARLEVESFHPVQPTLEDIFIQVAGEEGAEAMRSHQNQGAMGE